MSSKDCCDQKVVKKRNTWLILSGPLPVNWSLPSQLVPSQSTGPFPVNWSLPSQLVHSQSTGPLPVNWSLPNQLVPSQSTGPFPINWSLPSQLVPSQSTDPHPSQLASFQSTGPLPVNWSSPPLPVPGGSGWCPWWVIYGFGGSGGPTGSRECPDSSGLLFCPAILTILALILFAHSIV